MIDRRRAPWVAVLAIVAGSVLGSCSGEDSTAGGRRMEAPPAAATDASGADWPIHRGDRALCGVAPGSLNPKPATAWTFETQGAVTSSPVVADGVVYVGSIDGSVYALDLETGKKLWSFATEDAVEAPPLILDGRVYVGSCDSHLYALDARAGTLIWRFQTKDKIMGSANWTRARGGSTQILVGSYDASLYCLDTEGGKVWTYETGHYVNGTPAIDGDRVVVGGCDAVLHVVDAHTGKAVRKVELGAQCHVPGSVAIAGNRVFLGHHGNAFVGIDLDDESRDWVYAPSAHGYYASPAVGADRAVIGCRDGKLHCVGKEDGRALWTFPARRKIDASPVICGEHVVFGSVDGRLYMLTLAEGQEVWSHEIGQSILSSPAVARGMIVVGSNDKRVHAFRAR